MRTRSRARVSIPREHVEHQQLNRRRLRRDSVAAPARAPGRRPSAPGAAAAPLTAPLRAPRPLSGRRARWRRRIRVFHVSQSAPPCARAVGVLARDGAPASATLWRAARGTSRCVAGLQGPAAATTSSFAARPSSAVEAGDQAEVEHAQVLEARRREGVDPRDRRRRRQRPGATGASAAGEGGRALGARRRRRRRHPVGFERLGARGALKSGRAAAAAAAAAAASCPRTRRRTRAAPARPRAARAGAAPAPSRRRSRARASPPRRRRRRARPRRRAARRRAGGGRRARALARAQVDAFRRSS